MDPSSIWEDFFRVNAKDDDYPGFDFDPTLVASTSDSNPLQATVPSTHIASALPDSSLVYHEHGLRLDGGQKEDADPNTQHALVLTKTEGSPHAFLPDPPQSYLDVPSSERPTTSKRKADAVALEDVRHVSIKQVRKDNIGGVFMVLGRPTPRRARYEESRREEVEYNRKVGACVRCKKLKASCGRSTNPYEMCKGCTSLKNPFLLRLPCFLETLTEAQLFRNKASVNHPLHIARASVYELRDSAFIPIDTHNLRLSQGTGEELMVGVAHYLPQVGDKTAYVWTTDLGTMMVVELPPLCIVKLAEAKEQMLGYIERSRNAYICSLPADNLTSMVLDEARRFAHFNPKSTTRKALDLLAADRIIERDWIISGEESCDIPYVSDPDNLHYAKRPVTPMMDCQLDQLVIQGFLQPLRKELLEQLQININTDRQERWYDIFLTTFVLLVNAEQLLAHSRRNAQRHGAQGRYNSPELATLYFHACKMFIAHFRFVCNFKGLLSIDWRSAEGSAMARLDREQLTFLCKIKSKVQSNQQHMLNLRKDHEFERPSYWTHQIMFDGWNAGDPVKERHHINTAPIVCA